MAPGQDNVPFAGINYLSDIIRNRRIDGIGLGDDISSVLLRMGDLDLPCIKWLKSNTPFTGGWDGVWWSNIPIWCE